MLSCIALMQNLVQLTCAIHCLTARTIVFLCVTMIHVRTSVSNLTRASSYVSLRTRWSYLAKLLVCLFFIEYVFSASAQLG